MGNQLCYYEEQVLPQQNANKIPQDFQGINTMFQHISCDFCRLQLNFLIQSNNTNRQYDDNILLLNYKKQSQHFKRAPWQSPVFDQSETQFSQPTAFLHNDRISEITTSWFQLYMAQPKYQKLIENCVPGSADYKFIIEGQKLYKKEPSPMDILILYTLRWVVVEYFTGVNSLNSEEKLLSEGVSVYGRIAHICVLYRNILKSQIKQNDKQLIVLYSKLWKKYVEIMESVMQYYDQLQDQIQIVYGYWESQGHYEQNTKEKIPHLKFIGVMARFWYQIVWKTNSRSLCNNFEHIFEQEYFDTQALKTFINDIVDISFNEVDIHWIGHSKKQEKMAWFLKTWIISYIEEKTKLYFINLVIQKQNSEEIIYDRTMIYLKRQKQIYPSWLYDLYIEKPTIQQLLNHLSNYLQDRLSESGLFKLSPITVSTRESDDKLTYLSAIKKQKIDESYEKVSAEQVLSIYQDKDSLMAHFIDKIKETKSQQQSQRISQSSKWLQGKKQSIYDSSIFSTNCSLQPSVNSLKISQQEISQQWKTLLANINSLNVKLMERIILRDSLLEDRALFKQIPDHRYIPDFKFDDSKVKNTQQYDIYYFFIKNLTEEIELTNSQSKKDRLKREIEYIVK